MKTDFWFNFYCSKISFILIKKKESQIKIESTYSRLNLTHLNKRASPFSQFILVLAINKWKIWIKLDAYFSFNQTLANNKINLNFSVILLSGKLT